VIDLRVSARSAG